MKINQLSPNSKSDKAGKDITIKVLILFGMLLVMQIPVLMIRGLIDERQRLDLQSDEEIISSWGEELLLSQPKVEVDQYIRHLHALDIKVDIHPQELKRGIFTSRVYNTTVKYAFDFTCTVPQIDKPKGYPITHFMVPIGRQKIKGTVKITLNGNPVDETNSDLSILSDTMRFCIDGRYTPKKGDLVEITYNTTGSKGLQFIDISGFCGNTTMEVNSTWTSPNFNGTLLPDKRTVSKTGFTAQWSISNSTSSSDNTFGVELIDPVDHYRLTDRATKYALLFIALTFLAFFIAETVNKWRIHPIQYALVGAAMVVFYSLLLSFSEQVGFALAYLISSTATVMLISLYAVTILRKNIKSAFIIIVLLAMLYLFLYLILQMEDYALMAGSILLFATIATTMFCLKNVKWYGENEQ